MKYYVEDWRESEEDAIDATEVLGLVGENIGIDDVELWIQEIGEHIHNHRDGWESSWPLTVIVIDDAGASFRINIDRQSVPAFEGEAVAL